MSQKKSLKSFKLNKGLYLIDIDKYIDNAFDKSENDASGYNIEPTR